MRFSPAFLDEIRARVPVSEVVRKKVKLSKQGREWRGLSPFNAEKTPSFYVNDQKGFFHDFSSGKHGDGFTFLMETEGLSFPEAVERLATLAGLSMPVETKEQRDAEEKRATLADALEWAAVFFQKQLLAAPGTVARAYLDQRQITSAAREHFRLGYASSERHALRDHLAAKGVSIDTMIEAGLLIHGEDIAVPFDRFRNRIIFPICDRSGRVIAFGGRAMDADAQAKYLNSPETPLFHKGATLYNLHNARKSAHETGSIIAVEGYVDVIALTTAGLSHVVAPLGTALTAEQCLLLWRMADEPILCFDGDKAGLKAAYRAIDTALPLLGAERSLRFVLLPEGLDPDELLRANGPTAVVAALNGSLPLFDLLWMREVEGVTLDTPERRAALEKRLREVVTQIPDETLRRYYQQEISARLSNLFGRREERSFSRRNDRDFGSFRGQRSFGQRPETRPGPVHVGSALANSALFRGVKPVMSAREGLILLILLNHPDLLAGQIDEIAALDFAASEASALRDAMVLWIEMGGPDHEDLAQFIENKGFKSALGRLSGMAAHATLWSVRPEAASIDAAESLRQALVLHRRAWALNRELREV
ncbi:MAG: DNA primase, partial [Methylocystaceae bacterium]|nr:DNA primase [Methylocystaceae bacterium]